MRKCIFYLILSLVFTACTGPVSGTTFGPGSPDGDPDLILTAAFSGTPAATEQMLVLKRPTSSPTSFLTSPSKPASTHTPDAPVQVPGATDSTSTQIPTPSPTPTFPFPFRICSPLETNPIEDLPKIISDPYDPPPPGRDERHHGVDFSYYLFGERTTIHGAGVQSVLAGKTAAAIAGSYPFGNFVIIETPHEALPDELVEELAIPPGESLYLLYAHLEEAPQISLGEFIPPCYPLGSVGKSGNAGVSHLHLEARKGAPGAVFPVMSYYLQESTPEEKEYYLLWRTSEKYQHFNPMDLLLFERGNEG